MTTSNRRKPKAVIAPALPSSHLDAIDAAGFEVLSYGHNSQRVICSDGSERSEWLPQDMINWEKKLFVKWCTDDQYSFHGWQPQKGHQFGGRYDTVQSALAWFTWMEQQEAAR